MENMPTRDFSIRAKQRHFDGYVFNALCKMEAYDAIINNTFSASQEDRTLSVRSYVPNATELCVKNAKVCIISIRISEEGKLNA
jgi:hypothetical protein